MEAATVPLAEEKKEENKTESSKPKPRGRPKKKTAQKAGEPSKPKIKWKHDDDFVHHLFKAELSTCKKNVSHTPGMVQIEPVEHIHFFHTHNSLGKEQRYTDKLGGHFHEVKWEIGEDGDIIAKCGPALITRKIKLPNGTYRTKYETQKWFDRMQDKEVIDDHRHDMSYINSEILSKQAAKDRINQHASKIVQQRASSTYSDETVSMRVVDN